MAFWLADTRRGQDSDYIARFDPRFWTVNFPRPVMASVVSTAADALRVDCEFHHEGELAGLIWASEDMLDHPLLAYETQRSYAHCELSFRWRSSGIVALDMANGPTLTIEGRDKNGAARTWYVRLWNYATGTPQNARIELRFSDLEAGFVLPGERVHPGDIDRMFISLVPQGYVPGSTKRLAQRQDGWVELTDILCEGENALLAIGDVMLPPHGERICTAYDDAFDQTPARIVRGVRGLGYREDIIHYVGMSHFYRLEPQAGRLLAAGNGTLTAPARQWHENYFAEAHRLGFTVTTSLSYELFAENCPDEWQQRAFDGEPARTGWVPPSALLSPAHGQAMEWLQAVAARFVAMQEAARLPARFQIGEPWWWVLPDGRPCIYDDAARNAYEIDAVAIASMRDPLDAAQKALLDEAGRLLAASTRGLADAVRDAATGPVEVLLLAFTPTVLDPDMPELERANLPAGWAWPAFDRLQLEDYDWLTAGKDGLRRNALVHVDEKLGYPIERQDYLSGFVLNAADAANYWPRIDAALDHAQSRGVTRRYVWAQPQVNRDGYTRMPVYEEDDMQAFDDVLYPLPLGRDSSVSPEFSTSIAVTSSGHERRNSLWSDARIRYDVGPGVRSEEELGMLLAFFRARRGPAVGFRLRDPFDWSSNGMTGQPGQADQVLGVGDGMTTDFALRKSYGEQVRHITRPRPDTILVSLGGTPVSHWSYHERGIIQFDTPPPVGVEIRAGFAFDVPVRFAEDRIDISGAAFAAGEAPSIPLIEIREVA